MKTYQFSPEDFAKLVYLLTETVSLFGQERTEAEFRHFQSEIYPLLHEVQYRIVCEKIDERQHAAISRDDPWPPDGPHFEEAIATLTKIFST